MIDTCGAAAVTNVSPPSERCRNRRIRRAANVRRHESWCCSKGKCPQQPPGAATKTPRQNRLRRTEDRVMLESIGFPCLHLSGLRCRFTGHPIIGRFSVEQARKREFMKVS